AVRRRARERRASPMTAHDPTLDMPLRELLQALHEELERLPEHYRAPLVLCYLEGKTQEEAATLLGWSRDATRGRLDRRREQPPKRLARRGVSLVAAGCALAVARPSAAAARPLVRATLAALDAGASANVTALAQGAIHAMNATKTKLIWS